jgi:predicted Zn-dependent peptidase
VLFDTFNNAHNGYGSFVDLESATVDDAKDFFNTFYAPGNAQLAVTGDFDVAKITALIEKHFGSIKRRKAPKVPDLGEPGPTEERRAVKYDAMAPMPAVAAGYRVPDPIKRFDEYLATVVMVEVLTDGEGSRLHQRLVKEDRVASHIGGMIGTFGDPFDVRDPTLLQLLAYHPGGTADELLRAVDEEVEKLVDEGIADEELERVQTSLVSGHLRRLDNLLQRSMFMATLEQQRKRAELVNELPELLAAVDAAAVVDAAEAWLRPDARAVLEVRPGTGEDA